MKSLFSYLWVACFLVSAATEVNAAEIEISPLPAASTEGVTVFQMLESAARNQNILKTLEGYTLGNDGFYNKVISPGKIPNANLSAADRTARMNEKMASELSFILNAFDSAGEEQKPAAALSAAKKINPNLNSLKSANIEFIDGTPSAAISRTFLLIEKKNLTGTTALEIFSSYKRAAKPSEEVYEYSDASNLTQGQIKHREGSDVSWVKPNAPPPLVVGEQTAIKKCRQIFGWKCVTSLYLAGSMGEGLDVLPYVYMGSYDLQRNPDHADFVNDKRSFNQVAGSTALYVARESSRWVLLVGIDAQWNHNSIMFGSLIQQEFQKEFARLSQRFELDTK